MNLNKNGGFGFISFWTAFIVVYLGSHDISLALLGGMSGASLLALLVYFNIFKRD